MLFYLCCYFESKGVFPTISRSSSITGERHAGTKTQFLMTRTQSQTGAERKGCRTRCKTKVGTSMTRPGTSRCVLHHLPGADPKANQTLSVRHIQELSFEYIKRQCTIILIALASFHQCNNNQRLKHPYNFVLQSLKCFTDAKN